MQAHSFIFNSSASRILKALLGFAGWVGMYFIFIVVVLPPQYMESYQSVIIREYDRYRTMDNSKIVLIGTSALAFGCDLDLLEEKTGYDCVILGNHAGMASPYFIEMSKCNLNPGDIVIIQFSNYHKKSLGAELLYTAIDNRVDMYQFFRWYNVPELVFRFHDYAANKCYYWMKGGYHASGQYSSSAFDERGNMIIERIGCEEDYPLKRESIRLDDSFNQDYIAYLKDYIEYCNSSGCKVYFTVSPALDEWLVASEEECNAWNAKLNNELEGRLISKQQDYLYNRKYMYGLEHCNTVGAKKRTLQLYEDMKKIGLLSENLQE